MNEIRDLIIGIDFGKETAQVFYFDRKAQEPRALSMKAGTNLCEVPVLLLRRGQQGDFLAGLEAESYEKEHGGELITDLYDLTGLEKKEGLPGGLAPWEYAAAFLKGILKYLGVASVPDNTRSLIITVPSLTEARVANLRKACESLGFASGKYALMDHEEAFYYHVMTQQKEPLSRSVGWYEFEGNRVVFRRLEIFRNRKPAMVRFGESKETTLSPDPVMKDSEFAAWAEKTLGQELYTSIQISGEGFSQSWAKASVKTLCYHRRRVYVGNNLFARGACMAGKERTEDHALKAFRFLGKSRVLWDIGMEMRVMGSPAYYPLIESGSNWYEASRSCELILDDKKELVFLLSLTGSGERKKAVMELPGLPARPNRTTRLLVELSCLDPEKCCVTVTDLGFGEMFPSSGRVWKEIVSPMEE